MSDGFNAEWRTSDGVFKFSFEPEMTQKNNPKWQQQGLFDHQNDPIEGLVVDYLAHCTEAIPRARTQAAELYRSFHFYCRMERELEPAQIPSLKGISPMLRAQRHIERQAQRLVFYRGIQIRPEWIAPAGWQTGSQMFDRPQGGAPIDDHSG